MSMKQILIIEEEDGSKTILGAPEKKMVVTEDLGKIFSLDKVSFTFVNHFL